MKTIFISIAGVGAENHERTSGTFEVRYSKKRVFTELSDAFNFFNKLDYPASLYDITSIPVCLEWKILQEFENPSLKLNSKEII